MKKTLLSLLVIAIFGAINAFTAPLYFTFTGKINFVPQDIGGYAAAHGYRAGVEVTYIVVVDTARIGYTELNGVKKNQPDSINEGRGYRADYFFDSLLTPSLFSPAVTDLSSGSNLGYHITMKLGANTSNTASFQVTIGNPNHRTQIQVTIPNSTDNLFLPVVGTSVTASEAYMNSSVASSSASMSMTLIAVSATRPSIGIRALSRLDQSWMRADFQDGSLSMRNNTGRMLSASILNLEGKIVRALSLGAVASFPASSLPRGIFLLKVADPGHGAPVLQAFAH